MHSLSALGVSLPLIRTHRHRHTQTHVRSILLPIGIGSERQQYIMTSFHMKVVPYICSVYTPIHRRKQLNVWWIALVLQKIITENQHTTMRKNTVHSIKQRCVCY